MAVNWRFRAAFTGVWQADNNWEIRPSWAHRFWPEALHYAVCWLLFIPHLGTVSPDHRRWFWRRWLTRLPFFELSDHHYPNAAPQGEAFGAHCHSHHAISFIYKGGYRHRRWDNMRNEGAAAKSWVQDVGRFSFWFMHADDGHKVIDMQADTRSLFLQFGKRRPWFFLPSETKGSSRVLRYTKGVGK